MARSLQTIAREISFSWKKPFYGAVPYLDAMGDLSSMSDMYGADDARSIVAYFLSNATAWRGDDARRIKKELNDMLKREQYIDSAVRVHGALCESQEKQLDELLL